MSVSADLDQAVIDAEKAQARTEDALIHLQLVADAALEALHLSRTAFQAASEAVEAARRLVELHRGTGVGREGWT